jgi:cytochrome c-type biogenesis protein
MLNQVYIHLFVAIAGLVSFLSPCVLPLVPPYLGYLGGTTVAELGRTDEIDAALWRRVVLASVFFVQPATGRTAC